MQTNLGGLLEKQPNGKLGAVSEAGVLTMEIANKDMAECNARMHWNHKFQIHPIPH
jgi:hypothetical protein